jgi:hypothetical protein
MKKQKPWQVRVVRKVEEWVTVYADTPLQAETLAATLPQVLSVFSGSVIRGDRPKDEAPLVGVEEDEDE